MPKRNLNDLLAFVTVAREGSFTRAAAQLGVTQSALSQAVRGLEARLEIRLLTRTTRSVSPTAAGERLANAIGHRFDEIEGELEALTAVRKKPAGTVRLTCGDSVLKNILLPTDAAATRVPGHQLGIRRQLWDSATSSRIVSMRVSGSATPLIKNMIAVAIGPEVRMAAVASAPYFAKHPKPNNPRDLTNHRCINLRFPTYGGLDVLGNSSVEVEHSKCGSEDRSCSTPRRISHRRRLTASASLIFLKRNSSRISTLAAWSVYSKIGARHSRDITFTIPADASPLPRSLWCWKR